MGNKKRKLDKKNSYLDVNLAREKLNFNSKTNLNSGLLETIKWFNNNKNKFPFYNKYVLCNLR